MGAPLLQCPKCKSQDLARYVERGTLKMKGYHCKNRECGAFLDGEEYRKLIEDTQNYFKEVAKKEQEKATNPMSNKPKLKVEKKSWWTRFTSFLSRLWPKPKQN